jgi:hypothetical protein
MNKVLTIAGGVLFLLLLGGGAFYGGMLFERSQATDGQADFFAERGGGPDGFGGLGFRDGQDGFFQSDDHEDGQSAVPGQAGFGRGLSGQVKSIKGGTLLLSTPQDVTTVILTDQTTIIRMVTGELDDLQPDQRVTVIGQRNEAGEIIATVIQILIESP